MAGKSTEKRMYGVYTPDTTEPALYISGNNAYPVQCSGYIVFAEYIESVSVCMLNILFTRFPKYAVDESQTDDEKYINCSGRSVETANVRK